MQGDGQFPTAKMERTDLTWLMYWAILKVIFFISSYLRRLRQKFKKRPRKYKTAWERTPGREQKWGSITKHAGKDEVVQIFKSPRAEFIDKGKRLFWRVERNVSLIEIFRRNKK